MNIKYIPSKITSSPYSEVVIVNDYLYLSGLVSENMKTGELLLGDIEFETDNIMNNLAQILNENDSGMDRLIRIEIYLRDYRDIEKMNATYIKHIPKEKLPSRLCVQVADLCDQCKIEVVAMACK